VHQQEPVCDFVLALASVLTCCQAALARFFNNFEAASKRSRLCCTTRAWRTDLIACAHARPLVTGLRSELSLVRSVVELLTQEAGLWWLLDHQKRLDLEAGLYMCPDFMLDPLFNTLRYYISFLSGND
jgi:hypothetical protein